MNNTLTPQEDAFIQTILSVCKVYGYCLVPAPSGGELLVVRYDERHAGYIKQAVGSQDLEAAV